jgi:hypothetical protein
MGHVLGMYLCVFERERNCYKILFGNPVIRTTYVIKPQIITLRGMKFVC